MRYSRTPPARAKPGCASAKASPLSPLMRLAVGCVEWKPSAGRIDTPIVVNAAGPWASQIGEMVGIDVPVKPYRREIFVSEPFPRTIIGDAPLVIDLHVGWYFRREGEGILMSGEKDAHSSFDQYVNWPGFSNASRRLPCTACRRWRKRSSGRKHGADSTT